MATFEGALDDYGSAHSEIEGILMTIRRAMETLAEAGCFGAEMDMLVAASESAELAKSQLSASHAIFVANQGAVQESMYAAGAREAVADTSEFYCG